MRIGTLDAETQPFSFDIEVAMSMASVWELALVEDAEAAAIFISAGDAACPSISKTYEVLCWVIGANTSWVSSIEYFQTLKNLEVYAHANILLGCLILVEVIFWLSKKIQAVSAKAWEDEGEGCIVLPHKILTVSPLVFELIFSSHGAFRVSNITHQLLLPPVYFFWKGLGVEEIDAWVSYGDADVWAKLICACFFHWMSAQIFQLLAIGTRRMVIFVKGRFIAIDVFAVEWIQAGIIHLGSTASYGDSVKGVLELIEIYQKGFAPLGYFVAGCLNSLCLLRFDFACQNFRGFNTVMSENQAVLISATSDKVLGTTVAERPLIAACSGSHQLHVCSDFALLCYFVAQFLKFLCLLRYSYEIEYLAVTKAEKEGKISIDKAVVGTSDLYTDIMGRSNTCGIPRASSPSSIDSMTPVQNLIFSQEYTGPNQMVGRKTLNYIFPSCHLEDKVALHGGGNDGHKGNI